MDSVLPAKPVFGDGRLLWMFGVSVADVLIGIAAFRIGEAVARRQGSLGRY